MIHFLAKLKTTDHLRSHTSRTVNTITVSHQQLQEVTTSHTGRTVNTITVSHQQLQEVTKVMPSKVARDTT